VVAGAETVGVFWDKAPLLAAVRLSHDTVHVRLDLRPLGVNIHDDDRGLHVGDSLLAGNDIGGCDTAIGLA